MSKSEDEFNFQIEPNKHPQFPVAQDIRCDGISIMLWQLYTHFIFLNLMFSHP